MTFLAVTPQDERQREQNLALTPGDPDAFKPGLFEGVPAALGTGLERVAATANALAGTIETEVGSLATIPLDRVLGTDMTGFLEEDFERAPQAYLASIHPDPRTTGTIGQVLYGLVGVGLPAVAGAYLGGPAGAAIGAGSFQAQGTFADLRAEGVDTSTAQLAAVEEGAFAGVGVAAPMALGRNVLANALLFGPAVNVAQDLAAGEIIGNTLRGRGYAAMADRYQALDTETLIADAVLGAAFGYFGARGNRARFNPERLAGRELSVEAIDAALVAQDVRHAEIDTAPGIPTTDAARRAHVDTLARAERDLLDGQPVRAEVPEDGFLPRAVDAPEAIVAQALHDAGYPEIAAQVRGLELELAALGRSNPDAPLPEVPKWVEDPARPLMTDAGHVEPAHVALGRADADVVRAQREAGPTFEAAVNCFLRTAE